METSQTCCHNLSRAKLEKHCVGPKPLTKCFVLDINLHCQGSFPARHPLRSLPAVLNAQEPNTRLRLEFMPFHYSDLTTAH